MNVLLDTHALIWYFEGNLLLSKKARFEIGNSNNTKFISIVSFYEMAIKLKLGKLVINKSLGDYYADTVNNNIQVVPIEPNHLTQYQSIPLFDEHRDPFDRMIIATAVYENCAIITTDKKFELYKEHIDIIF